MAHDLFISHSSKDKTISDAICAALEGAGIRCWIAPRDVQPGRSFAGEINRAIQQSKVMVLVFSASSNNSEQILREVQLAVNSHLHIVQFRLEDVRLNDDLGYFLSTPHWLDAMQPPLENHIHRLKTSIKVLLDAPPGQTITSAAPAEPEPSPPVAQPVVFSPPESEMRDAPAPVLQKREVSTASPAPSPPVNRGRKFMFAGAIVAFLAAGVLGGWWFGIQQPRKEKERLAAQQRAKEEIAAATRVKPYKNSLGMKFVPVPITSGKPVLFSVWETRVRDFAQFIEESGYDMKKGEAGLHGGVGRLRRLYSVEAGGRRLAGPAFSGGSEADGRSSGRLCELERRGRF